MSGKKNITNALIWNVYVESINRKEITTYNIFTHSSFLKDCKEHIKEYAEDREAFLEEVRKSLMYYFWSKCEWEIIISDWPPSKNFDGFKVDVYDQVMMNWGIFSQWLWENRELINDLEEE